MSVLESERELFTGRCVADGQASKRLKIGHPVSFVKHFLRNVATKKGEEYYRDFANSTARKSVVERIARNSTKRSIVLGVSTSARHPETSRPNPPPFLYGYRTSRNYL